MKTQDLCFLNVSAVENRFIELDLKQWWVAEQLGVSPRTVLRWLNGQVKQVHRANVERLAQVLQCPPESLMVATEEDTFATAESQAHAARLIDEEGLIETFRLQNKWELFESIIQSVMNPHLPLHRLGLLYILLAHAKLMQANLEGTLHYANHAQEIGEKRQDSILVAQAQGYLGLAYSYQDKPHLAEQCYRRFRDLESFVPPETRACLRLSYGTMFVNMGKYGEARELLEPLCAYFEQVKDREDLARARMILGISHMEEERYAEGKLHLEQALTAAIEGRLAKREAFIKVYLMLCEAHAGNWERVNALRDEAHAGYRELGMPTDDYFMHYMEARVRRLEGRIEEAEALCLRALQDPHVPPALRKHMESTLEACRRRPKG